MERAARIGEEARRRFVRWDAKLWQRLVSGPATELQRRLAESAPTAAEADSVFASYLQLLAEGIGLGYIVPEAAGVQTFLTLAFTRLLPASLAALRPAAQAEALAACWNLGENLETSPFWVRRVFLRAAQRLGDVRDLEAFVADVSRRALEPPQKPLGRGFEPRWVHLAEEDQRFLPGNLHFTAPTVACVHDRHRSGALGSEIVSLGVFLDAEPMLLGPMGCRETPPADPGLRMELLSELAEGDPRAADWFAMAANEWRAAVTLDTSQFLVVLVPA